MDVSQLLKWDTEAELKKTQDKDKERDKSSYQLTDKLIEKLFAMALPPTTTLDGTDLLRNRVKASAERPPLSIPVMSKNFIQLNSRLSGPFSLVNNIIHFLQWRNPSMNFTLLLIYTNIIMNPIPIICVIFPLTVLHFMTENFIKSYLPDTVNSIERNPSHIRIKKIDKIKPTSELSKEFILNLTDLQNHMLLYVDGWDLIVHGLNKFINWNDEAVSTVIFFSTVIFTFFLFLFSNVILRYFQPLIKMFLILFGWGFVLSIHPKFYDTVNDFIHSESTRLYILKKTNKLEELFKNKIDYFDEPEVKEVRMYEIWKLNEADNEWNMIGFKNTAYWQNDVQRMTYIDLDGKLKSRTDLSINTELDDDADNITLKEEDLDVSFVTSSLDTSTASSLEKIGPPTLWKFKPNSKWKVDLFPGNWIREDLLREDSSTIIIDHEGKWVYDNITASGKYRRRLWTRDVIRSSQLDENSSIDSPTSPTRSNKKKESIDSTQPKSKQDIADNRIKEKTSEIELIKQVRSKYVQEQMDYR